MHVTQDEVQQWLETTKLAVGSVDPELEASASVYVFAYVGATVDTSSWVDVETTPDLIRKLISMLVAAWVYERTYSESVSDQPTWADRLEAMVAAILTGILNGTVVIDGIADPRDFTPMYWPDNTTGSTQQYDAQGNELGIDQYSEDIKFTMGTRF